MEVLESVADQKIDHTHPLTAMIWTNEEGSLYPPAMMVSGIVCYDFLPEDVKKKFRYDDMMASKNVLDKQENFGKALDASGFKGDAANRLSPDAYKCMFELHVEQGPILEDAGNDVGVVDCVLGMFNYRLRFYGQTVHAGTFPMPKRRDALFAASQALCFLHKEIDALGYSDLVYTTGEIECHPNIHTCVPDEVDFCIDVRHESSEVLEKVLAIVTGCADKKWAGCTCKVDKMWNRATVYWDKNLVRYLKKSAEETGVKHQMLHSGAGHDAQFASYMLPTAMVFVQSKDGLSHCESEYSSPEHCTSGATVLLNAVLKADAEE
jgi:N-carbamoyl-L-amino-acid hydrolase